MLRRVFPAVFLAAVFPACSNEREAPAPRAKEAAPAARVVAANVGERRTRPAGLARPAVIWLGLDGLDPRLRVGER